MTLEDPAMLRRLPPLLGTLVAFGAMLIGTEAAPPVVAKISLQTLQSGGTTTITIEGTDLAPNPRILLPFPIAAQSVKDGATDKKVQLDVKLANDVAPGIYQMRVGSDKGISNPMVVEVDTLPQQTLVPQTAQLPVVLHGTLAGSATVQTTINGKRGQRLVMEVEARRLGSAIEPIVKLYNPQRLQVAWAQGSGALAGDARLTTVLPADGTYTVELHDIQYKAGNPGRFRLKLGDLQYADLAFPLAWQRGTKGSFQLIGSVSDKARVEADLTAAPGGSHITLPRVPGQIGPSPRILVTDIPEVLKTEQADGKLQEVMAPVGINGRLKAKEEDRYKIKVEPGAKLRFDVLAERAGSPIDGVLILRNEAGAQLVRSDDQPGTLDPGMEYIVPAGVTALVAAVSDLHGRGGPDYVYRLSVTPVGQPDFSLAILDDRPHVPQTGAALVRIRATRVGYTGPIKLALQGVPEGVTVTGDEIPAGATDTLLSFTVPEGGKLTQGVLQIVGESTEPPLKRLAVLPETPLSKPSPWFRTELAVAVTEPGKLGVVWEAPEANLPLGGKNNGTVKITRAADIKGAVRLSLVTSQIMPKTKDNKDDVNKALRLEGTPTVAADQAMAEVKVLVPADLPAMPYDVAIKADILGPDGKMVLQSAVTPSRRMTANKAKE
jgi:hypothetical protein